MFKLEYITGKDKRINRSYFNKNGFSWTKDKFRICTYLHYYDSEKYPFYIGSGTLLRAYSINDRDRTNSWIGKVKDINKLKVVIYKIDITKYEAKQYEEELITKYIKYGNLINVKISNVKYIKYKLDHDVDKRNWACFDLKGNHIRTFNTLKEAALTYLTTKSNIKNCTKNNKNFRGILKWVKI